MKSLLSMWPDILLQTGFSESSGQSEPAQQSVGVPYAGEGADIQLNAINKNQLPQYFQALESALPGYTTAATNSANQAQAGMQATGASLYGALAPYLNQVGQQLGGSNLQANANAIGSTLNSPAASQIGQGFTQGQQQLNPAYNSTMSGLSSLMSNISPNQFTGSQLDQVNRGLAQSNFQGGNANTFGASPITSLNNAMTFGSGLQNLQSQFSNIAGQTANTANALNQGQNLFGLTTGQPTGTASANTNTNPSQFLQSPSTAAGIGTTGTQFGTSTTGQIGSTYNTGNASAAAQNMSSNSSVGNSAGCCFIMVLGSNAMPWYIRSMRDVAYSAHEGMRDGYSIMAQFLCPIMLWSCVAYWLIEHLMVKPIAEHAGYLAGQRGCRPRINHYKVWRFLWIILGKL